MTHATRLWPLNSNTTMTLGLASLALGVLFNSIFVAVALGFMGLSVASRRGSKAPGYSIAGLAALLLLLQIGYGIGKDLAHRDSAAQAPGVTTGA